MQTGPCPGMREEDFDGRDEDGHQVILYEAYRKHWDSKPRTHVWEWEGSNYYCEECSVTYRHWCEGEILALRQEVEALKKRIKDMTGE
jgi:hypothetical protein